MGTLYCAQDSSQKCNEVREPKKMLSFVVDFESRLHVESLHGPLQNLERDAKKTLLAITANTMEVTNNARLIFTSRNRREPG